MALLQKYDQLPVIFKLVGAALALAGVGYTSWEDHISPKIAQVAEKQALLDQATNDLKSLTSTLVNPLTLEEELSRANREFKRLTELLPAEPAVDRVLNDFASLSRLTGTEIREFSPQTDDKKNPNDPNNISPQYNSAAANQGKLIGDSKGKTEEANAIELQLKIYGTFSSLLSFLDLSMSLPRVIRIKSFEIANPDTGLQLTQKPKLTFTGKFLAYYQKQNSQLADASARQTATTSEKSPTQAITKPAIDLNEVIDKSFSAKSLKGDSK
ncbi:hypothetical protein EBU99_12730 [bacterium]|nr:hypothetical protein [bacterium]